MIEYFKFEIIPWVYDTPLGKTKQLEIKMKVDGEDLTSVRMMPDQRPFEAEVEYYARIAIEELKRVMADGHEKSNKA